jgi:hypothetical protein
MTAMLKSSRRVISPPGRIDDLKNQRTFVKCLFMGFEKKILIGIS